MAPNHIASTLIVLALTTALALPAAASDPVAPLMTEVQPNPVGDDRGNEWVEFSNPSPVDLPLDGLYLTDGEGCFAPGEGFVGDYRWPLSGTVPAAGHLVVTLPASCVNLANTADDLHLVTEDGTVLQSVVYGTPGGLTTPAEGQSLYACHAAVNLHAGWATGTATPGETNPAC